MAKDDLIEEIVPRIFRGRRRGQQPERTLEYYRDIESPSLREEIKELKYKLKKANEKKAIAVVKVREKKNEKILEQETAAWKKKRQNYRVTQNEMNARAKEYFYDKVKSQIFSSTGFVDSITAYPVINEMTKHFNMDQKKLGLFILICHFEWFQYGDGEIFGYKKEYCKKWINIFVSEGLAEKFINKTHSFAVSLKGKELFVEMHKYYKKHMKVLFDGYDKNQKRTKGWTGIKFNK